MKFGNTTGNLIGKILGESEAPSQAINLMIHMDELSLKVKRVNEYGSLRVNPLGGIHPFNFGQKLVDIMRNHKNFSGILSFGSMHTTKESLTINKITADNYRGLVKLVLGKILN